MDLWNKMVIFGGARNDDKKNSDISREGVHLGYLIEADRIYRIYQVFNP